MIEGCKLHDYFLPCWSLSCLTCPVGECQRAASPQREQYTHQKRAKALERTKVAIKPPLTIGVLRSWCMVCAHPKNPLDSASRCDPPGRACTIKSKGALSASHRGSGALRESVAREILRRRSKNKSGY